MMEPQAAEERGGTRRARRAVLQVAVLVVFVPLLLQEAADSASAKTIVSRMTDVKILFTMMHLLFVFLAFKAD